MTQEIKSAGQRQTLKALFISAFFLLCLTHKDFAGGVLLNRPTKAKLKTALKIPVVSAGKQSGWILVPKGSPITVKDVREHKLRIGFAGAQTWVERSDTDFDRRLAAFNASRQKVMTQQAQQGAAWETFNEQRRVAAAHFQSQEGAYQDPPYQGPLYQSSYDQPDDNYYSGGQFFYGNGFGYGGYGRGRRSGGGRSRGGGRSGGGGRGGGGGGRR